MSASDTTPQTSPISLAEVPNIPLAYRLAAIVLIVAVALPVAVHLYVMNRTTWPGPPLQIRLGGPNPQGDSDFLQMGGSYNPNFTLYGLHPVIMFNRNAQHLVLCTDVVHNTYANQQMAQLGIIANPGERAYWSSIHPKLGRRGCWHIVGLVN